MARRLSAIVPLDVAGYSALMAQDESGTLALLNRLRSEVLDPLLGTHDGRRVKLMGDGALAEFPSVVSAVEFAIAFQHATGTFADGQLRLRIGINLGDVILQGGDIFGDGVNIAARLEQLADPGGVCISGLVHDSLGNRVSATFRDGGMQTLKNIDRPVRAYHWVSGRKEDAQTEVTDWRSGKPSIAVLAFDNMSGDPEQEYFSDGIAEDIITELSHFREFFVIARNTSFAYKGQAVRIDKISRELGVHYVLEGSVRRAGAQVRVTAQLIDGNSGAHLWAKKFDRNLDDIFAVQDEITQAIVSAAAPETLGAELKRARSKNRTNLSAWDLVLQARWHLGKFNQSDNAAARGLLKQALTADPEMSDAYSALALALALCDLMAMLHLWRGDTLAAIAQSAEAAFKAISLDDTDATGHGMLGMAELFGRNFDAGYEHLQKGISLNTNSAVGHGNMSAYYGVMGDYEQAQLSRQKAFALSPRDPLRAFWRGGEGIGAYLAGAYEACVQNAREGLKEAPGYASLMRQEAAALAMLGREDEARASMDRLLHQMPELKVSQVRHMVPVRYPEDHERWLEGLRRAGLPE